MSAFNEARVAIVKLIVNAPDTIWTVAELSRQYPASDLNDVPSPQLLRKIIASLPPSCAKKVGGVWQVQARHAAPTSEIYPAIDALIASGAISEKYTLIAAVAEAFAMLTLIGVSRVDRALRYGAHGGKYTIEDGFYGPSIVLPSGEVLSKHETEKLHSAAKLTLSQGDDQREIEQEADCAEGETATDDQRDSLPQSARELYVAACRVLRSHETYKRKRERLAALPPRIVAAARASLRKPKVQSREERLAALRAKRAAARTYSELVIRGIELCEGDILMYSADSKTWLTVAEIDRTNRLMCMVHFFALDAAGRRIRKTVSETRHYPVRRPSAKDRVTQPLPSFLLPEPLL